MSVCQYCGKPLSFWRRLSGEEWFCSNSHRKLFLDEYERLALQSLLQTPAGTRLPDSPRAPATARKSEPVETQLSRPIAPPEAGFVGMAPAPARLLRRAETHTDLCQEPLEPLTVDVFEPPEWACRAPSWRCEPKPCALGEDMAPGASDLPASIPSACLEWAEVEPRTETPRLPSGQRQGQLRPWPRIEMGEPREFQRGLPRHKAEVPRWYDSPVPLQRPRLTASCTPEWEDLGGRGESTVPRPAPGMVVRPAYLAALPGRRPGPSRPRLRWRAARPFLSRAGASDMPAPVAAAATVGLAWSPSPARYGSNQAFFQPRFGLHPTPIGLSGAGRRLLPEPAAALAAPRPVWQPPLGPSAPPPLLSARAVSPSPGRTGLPQAGYRASVYESASSGGIRTVAPDLEFAAGLPAFSVCEVRRAADAALVRMSPCLPSAGWLDGRVSASTGELAARWIESAPPLAAPLAGPCLAHAPLNRASSLPPRSEAEIPLPVLEFLTAGSCKAGSLGWRWSPVCQESSNGLPKPVPAIPPLDSTAASNGRMPAVGGAIAVRPRLERQSGLADSPLEYVPSRWEAVYIPRIRARTLRPVVGTGRRTEKRAAAAVAAPLRQPPAPAALRSNSREPIPMILGATRRSAVGS